MKRLLSLLLMLVLVGVLTGCGGDRDKGINKDRDKPRETPAASK
jgi:hypothetical protein